MLKSTAIAVVFGCASHTAHADAANSSASGSNGNGPAALNMPFTIWADEGAKGKPFTPMRQLMQQAHKDRSETVARAPN